MDSSKLIHYFIAAVWIVNGLFCKVMNLAPRHQQIVGRIVSNEYAGILTKLIGVSEILMAVWILSRIKSKLNAMMQIAIVATMNVIEFFFVPDLLLWGKMNSFFALLFIGLVFYHEFAASRPK